MELDWSEFEGDDVWLPLWWYRDTGGSHHWWLSVNGEWFGYFKNNNSWFDEPGLQNGANLYDVGGEIVDNGSGSHTTTHMGSGRCPDDFSVSQLYSRVAYARNIRFVNTSNSWVSTVFNFDIDNGPYGMTSMNPHGTSTTWGRHFYLGGEGDDTCPNGP